MKQITTFTNSFVLQELDGSRVIQELGFKKGGLSYRIQNNNVKFYLVEDYFYKNVIWSADAPLTIDGVSYPLEDIPNALKKIFIQVSSGSGGTEVEIDEVLNDQSHNPVANRTITLKVREIEGKHDTLADQVRANTQGLLDRYTKIETNNLLKNYYTKQETRGMIANYTAVDGNTLKLNNEQITI
jgi:hypothetical protein